MSRQVIKFEINTPQTIALEYPDGIRVNGTYGAQVKFSLTDNRIMYLDQEATQAVKILNPAPGEGFTLVKRYEKGKRIWWEAEKLKAPAKAVEIPQTAVTPAPAPKIEPTPVSASGIGILESVPLATSPLPDRKPPQKTLEAPPPNRGLQLTAVPPGSVGLRNRLPGMLADCDAGLERRGGALGRWGAARHGCHADDPSRKRKCNLVPGAASGKGCVMQFSAQEEFILNELKRVEQLIQIRLGLLERLAKSLDARLKHLEER